MSTKPTKTKAGRALRQKAISATLSTLPNPQEAVERILSVYNAATEEERLEGSEWYQNARALALEYAAESPDSNAACAVESRPKVPAGPKASSRALTTVQPSSASSSRAGRSTTATSLNGVGTRSPRSPRGRRDQTHPSDLLRAWGEEDRGCARVRRTGTSKPTTARAWASRLHHPRTYRRLSIRGRLLSYGRKAGRHYAASYAGYRLALVA